MEQWVAPDGTVMLVHDADRCGGEYCVIHNPKPQPLGDASLLWRDDRGIFERICSHGIGHPDQSQFDFWERTDREYESVHGCDGCCFERG